MLRVPTMILAVLLTSSPALAKEKTKIPYSDTIGYKFCQDKDNFDCFVVKEKTVEIKIRTKQGEKTVKKTAPETWEELFPDEKIRGLVQKINRLNIKLKKGMPIAVPKDKNKTFADFSPFPEWIKTPEEKLIIFDPALLALAAYSPEGKLLRWMPAIGGMDRCPDTWRRCRTVVGTFKTGVKGDEKTRSHGYPIGCGSKKKPCALMAWFVPFFKQLYGFHASEKMEGKHASHGCVRLFLDDAKWLNQYFADVGTKVIIKKYPYPNRS